MLTLPCRGRRAMLLLLIGLTGCFGNDTPRDPPPPQVRGQPYGRAESVPPTVPSGFTVRSTSVAAAPTAMHFSADGSLLYVASATGSVLAYPVLAGGQLGPPRQLASGLRLPLGVLPTAEGVLVSVMLADGSGGVLRLRDDNGDGSTDATETVLSGLPVGRHNTNNLALGPDGLVYVLNGNANDSGFGAEGGAPDVRPYSGSLLRFPRNGVNLRPHPSWVVATGWRNPFSLAFVPPGHPVLPAGHVAVTMNGPDGQSYQQADGSTIQRPTGEDTLSLLDVRDLVIEHYGFPWCLYDRNRGGLAGFTQDAAQGSCTPLPAAAEEGLSGAMQRAYPVALFGTHVSANALAFNPGGSFPPGMTGDLFVAEFGANPPNSARIGRKIVRVRFAEDGSVASVEDFMSVPSPLALAFAPDGALWIGDFSGEILRVTGSGGGS